MGRRSLARLFEKGFSVWLIISPAAVRINVRRNDRPPRQRAAPVRCKLGIKTCRENQSPGTRKSAVKIQSDKHAREANHAAIVYGFHMG